VSGDWVDLSHQYVEGMHPEAYKAAYAMRREVLQHTDESCRLSGAQRFTIYAHQGTHVDSPSHIFKAGKSIDQYTVDRFIGEGVVWDIPKAPCEMISLGEVQTASPTLRSGDFLVVRTGSWQSFPDVSYLENPYFEEAAAEWIVAQGVRLVGIDMLNVDIPVSMRTPEFDYPVHRILLGNDVLIVENLTNVDQFVGTRVNFFFAPLNINGADGSPVRAFARS
jgi:arylformamidase